MSGRRRPDRDTLLLTLVSLAAGALVVAIAYELFPYHSSNHDEGVYLQQARLLLGGKLWFTTSTPQSFQWWFFVEDGSRLYGKYQPVVPALWAVGLAIGAPRLVLGVIGAGIVALVGLLAREAYDGPTSVLSAVLVVASPLFLLTTSTFLAYAPTTLLNLLFAFGYVRLLRSGRRGWALVTGLAVGLAFFARPYTAFLFALPFVGHALWLLWPARETRDDLRWRLERLLPVAGLGILFVGITLAYNWIVTGDPLLFPFAAFAPEDGVGFGHREILGYSQDYTLGLALRANATMLWEFVTRFVAAPPVGAVLVGVGIAVFGIRVRRTRRVSASNVSTRLPDIQLRTLFLGVGLSVVVGNVAFWGNLNALADLADPTDGLVAQFGPFYHFDLLLPLSVFGAAGAVWIGRRIHQLAVDRVGRRRALAVTLGLALVAAPVLGVAQVNALDHPLEENRAFTERYASAYEPFEERSFDRALVFVPTPYGEWLGHPFQWLQNDPGLDGNAVYALDRRPGEDFRVLDSYPDRQPYRFTYRGEWAGEPEAVTAHVQPLEVRDGRSHRITFETGVVGTPSTVRLSDGDDTITYDIESTATDTLAVEWVVTPGVARVVSPNADRRGVGVVDFDGSAELQIAVTYVQEGGATVTYRQELAVEERGETVRLVWPPEVEVCRLTSDCGYEGMYVPGGDYLGGVRVNQTVE